MIYTREYISEATGFDSGDEFTSEEQVREYFSPEEQRAMWGDDAITDADVLAEMADAVIEERWHCAF
jgi:hypothetical protein